MIHKGNEDSFCCEIDTVQIRSLLLMMSCDCPSDYGMKCYRDGEDKCNGKKCLDCWAEAVDIGYGVRDLYEVL